MLHSLRAQITEAIERLRYHRNGFSGSARSKHKLGVPMMSDDKAMAYNVFVWLFNVSTSIMIVFVNKILMGSNGYMFNFGVSH